MNDLKFKIAWLNEGFYLYDSKRISNFIHKNYTIDQRTTIKASGSYIYIYKVKE